MTTNPPTEPTVKKWEKDFDDDIYIPCSSSCASSTHPFADCNCEAPKIKREIKTRISTLLSQSVQKAKAEGDRIKEMIAGYNQEKLILTESLTTPRLDRNAGRATRHSIEGRLKQVDDLLTSLRQERGEI